MRDQDPGWEGRRHFFGAAAQAMREILIEQARHKGSLKHGGQAQRARAGRGPGLDRAAERRSARPGRGDPAAPGGRRATGGDRPAPLLHRAERRGNGQRGRRVGQHLEARLAVCAGLAGAAAGRRHALIGDGIGIPQAIGEPMTEPASPAREGPVRAGGRPAPPKNAAPSWTPPVAANPTSAPKSKDCWLTTPASERTTDEDGFLKSPLVRAPEATPSGSFVTAASRTSLGCRLTSAAIASSAGTAKVAWAPSTRPNRTTRAAPSPSR